MRVKLASILVSLLVLGAVIAGLALGANQTVNVTADNPSCAQDAGTASSCSSTYTVAPGHALTVVAPSTTTTASAALVGAQTAYSGKSVNGTGAAQDYAFTNATSGTVDTLHIHLAAVSTSDKAEVGLYSGTSSSASTRLGDCVITSPAASAWNACPIAAITITAGNTYWLAVLQPTGATGTLAYSEGQVSRAPATYLSNSGNLASLPATWTNGEGFSGGYRGSLYAGSSDSSSSSTTSSTSSTSSTTSTTSTTSTLYG